MAELNIRFDIRLSQGLFRYLIAALVVFASVGDVGSESVTLNTYYPAPSGVYQYMVTTNTTFLARDSGNVNIGYASAGTPANSLFVSNKVGIGTQNPQSVLDVRGIIGGGGATGIFIDSTGKVGINTTTPANKLQVVGSGGGTIDVAVNGRMQTGDGSNSGGIWLSGSNNMFVGQNGTTVGFWTGTNGWGLLQDQNGRIGLGVSSPVSELDVGGNDQVLTVRQTGCTEVSYSLGLTFCGGGQYATLTSGVMTQYNALGNLNGIDTGTGSQVYVYNGSMLCCTQPPGGMPAGW